MAQIDGIYSPEKIGERLALLGDHRVYRYADDSVIKFSQFDRFRSAPDLVQFYNTESARLAVVFKEYYLCPEIVTDTKRTRVGLIQPFITGKPLTKTHCANEHIRSQFHRIAAALEKHQRPGEYIDLVGGGKSLFLAAFGNIFVTSDNRLVIIDVSVVRSRDFVVWVRPFVTFVIFLGNRIQAKRIKNLRSYQ